MRHRNQFPPALLQALPLRTNLLRSLLVNFSALFVLLGAAAVAQASTITVNTTVDSLATNGTCSIREALINANNDAATWPDCAAGSGADTINLPAGTITFAIPNTSPADVFEEQNLRGDLDISSSLTINGNAAGTTINGNAFDRILDINPDVDQDPSTLRPLITVHINNLHITNGYQNQSGAVRVNENATATMDGCTVSSSTSWADDGGGVYVFSGGVLTMTNCTVSGNSALLLGGGIANNGTLNLFNSTVTNNTGVHNRGQGVSCNGVPCTMRNNIIAGNGPAIRADTEGTINTLGYNIIGKTTDDLGSSINVFLPAGPATGDQFDVGSAGVLLGALVNNGGPTPTHSLGAGSIAIDKGLSGGSVVDQRGELRPCDQAAIANATGGDGADIGAFEVQGTCVGGNAAPNAVDDSAIVFEDSGANTVSVLTNDSDPDMDTLTVTAVTQGTNGSVAITPGGGSVSYTPNPNFFGTDSFTYTISDGNSHTDTATVNVTVNNVQDPPVANDDFATVVEDSGPNTIMVLTNDADVDGDVLSVTGASAASNGTVTNNSTSVTYSPNPDYFGPDSFTYSITDGNGNSATATVHINVSNVNDAPVANNETYSMNQDTTLNVPLATGVLANDTDVDGDMLTAVYEAGSGPNHGMLTLNADGSFSYTPNPGFTGMDSFNYHANDGQADSNIATVTITINDTQAPVVNCTEATALLWPPNSDLINVGFNISATDNDGMVPTTAIAVFSNEDDETPTGSGVMSPDAKDIAAGTLRLRAERRGDSNGRVYIIRVTATDGAGNSSVTYCTVVVPQSQRSADITSVNAQAAAAVAAFVANGNNPPAGYFIVGDGPVIGSKQ